MMRPGLGTHGSRVMLVDDENYERTVRFLVERSRHRCLASIFIVDLQVAGNESPVGALLESMAEASARGVDVHLSIGGSSENIAIARSCEGAAARCQQLGIRHRLLSKTDQSLHRKVLVCDDQVLLGSHNWSAGAFRSQTQDSVLIDDSALAAWLATRVVN